MTGIRRGFQVALVAFAALHVAACSYFPPIDGPLSIGTNPEYIPLDAVRNQIDCELQDFLRVSYPRFENSKIRERLDPKKWANISLTVSSEVSSGLTYFGIDLSFLKLENLVSYVNGRSGIYAKIGSRAGDSVKFDINIPQIPNYKEPPVAINRPPAKQVKVNGQQPPLTEPSSEVAGVDCSNLNDLNSYLVRLRLNSWLDKFFASREANLANRTGPYCQPRLHFTSTFVVFANLNASLNPFGTTKFLAPVNLFQVEFNPSHTHSVNVTFNFTDKDSPSLCRAQP